MKAELTEIRFDSDFTINGVEVKAGTVWVPARQSSGQERGEAVAYLCDGMRFKVGHFPQIGVAILNLPLALNGQWVALVDATDNKHMNAAPADAKSRIAELEALVCRHEQNIRDMELLLSDSRRNLTESREREGRMREALEAFDKAAKESSSIIGFAGKALKLITNARAALYRTANDAEWKPNMVYGDEPQDELMLVEVRFRNGRVESGTAASFFWNHTGSDDDIMQWRPEAALAADKEKNDE